MKIFPTPFISPRMNWSITRRITRGIRQPGDLRIYRRVLHRQRLHQSLRIRVRWRLSDGAVALNLMSTNSGQLSLSPFFSSIELLGTPYESTR